MVARNGRPIQGNTRIAQIMRKKNIRIYQVTGKMEMSERAFRERLHGHMRLTPDEQARLAKILDVPVEWLDEDDKKEEA